MNSLKKILSSLPHSPGVYQFFNNAGKIIYIGKSINLKSRVNSYFNGKAKLNFAKQKMVEQIADIKYIITRNETESLILETNLIKEYSPKYNILMKDGKNHVYIKITDEFVPRIIKTRQKNDNKSPLNEGGRGEFYFGPYLSTHYVNNILKLIQKIFGYRSCNIKFELKKLMINDKGLMINKKENLKCHSDKLSLPQGGGMSANADRGELENQLNSSCHYDGGQNQLKVSNPYNLKNKEFLNFIDPNSHQDDIKNKIILSNISNTKIPCIYYYIKRCVGPCLKEEDKILEYQKKIEEIKDFLNGNINKIKAKLEGEMKEKAKALKFEEAGKIKENLDSIKSLEETQIVREGVNGDYNVVNFIEKFDKFFIALMEIRNSKITGFYNYEIKNNLEESYEKVLKTFVEQYHSELVSKYLTNISHSNNKESFVNYYNNKRAGNKFRMIQLQNEKITYILPFEIDFEGLPIKTEIPKIGVKKELLDMCYRNIYEYAYKSHLDSLSTKGFTKKNMQNLLEILGYKQINKNIIFECNDISHISGNYTVASRSVIENGKTASSKYRKFKIKTLEDQKINDFDSMREIITRRLKEIEKTKFVPDLIVIDGGKGQLSSVLNQIKEEREKIKDIETIDLIDNLQIVSIAKKEEELFKLKAKSGKLKEDTTKQCHSEVISESFEDYPNVSSSGLTRRPFKEQELPNFKSSLVKNSDNKKIIGSKPDNDTTTQFQKILLDKSSLELKLIQKIRDEAHRFAITFNRDSRIKASKKNILESLPGFGAITRKKLLKKYGNVEKLKDVSKEELKEVLNRNQIETLENHLII